MKMLSAGIVRVLAHGSVYAHGREVGRTGYIRVRAHFLAEADLAKLNAGYGGSVRWKRDWGGFFRSGDYEVKGKKDSLGR